MVMHELYFSVSFMHADKFLHLDRKYMVQLVRECFPICTMRQYLYFTTIMPGLFCCKGGLLLLAIAL